GIPPLAGFFAKLYVFMAAIEAKLGKPPDNSAVPPSQGQKPTRAERRAAKKREGHPRAFRQLSETPIAWWRRGQRRARIAITSTWRPINPSFRDSGG
ncbi:MAG: hypothetical protein WCP82_07040, partial [Alphaproteobacteria bacterium]